MSRISVSLRTKVGKRAGFRCEYCQIPEFILATSFHVDHIQSIKHGGNDHFDNLAFACPHCNQNKGTDIATLSESKQLVRFFNPRIDLWNNHFENHSGLIIGKSDIGNATSKILDFNQTERVILRQLLTELKII